MTSNDDISGMEATPVGVTIAFKKHHRQANPEEPSTKPRSSHKKSSKRRSSSSLQQMGRERKKSVTLKRKIGTITKPISSWTVFLEGASLYAASLFLPALIGALYQAYRGQWSFRNTLIYEYVMNILCPLEGDHDSAYLWSSWICEFELPTEANVPSILEADIRIISSSSSMHDDIWKVTMCAAGLALVRMLIVHMTVMPLQSSNQLLAMVRCKSIHLLSSDYSQTPVATPVREKTNLAVDDAALASIQMPPLGLHNNNMASENAYDSDQDEGALGLQYDESERDNADVLFYRSQHREEDEKIFDTTPGMTNQTDEEGYSSPDEPDSPSQVNNRLYSGPRYATAVFRLLYCTVTSVLALLYFRDADFWPWYVGGSGSTAHCWDLSGGLIVSGMDADFDQRNALLKRYFLWQASYHWHSGAFHVLSLFALLISPENRSTLKQRHQFFDDLRTNTQAYARSLAIHVLTLIIITLAYVFSSLRRLAAIGMFAFDVSSWFLHLLQVCINAPANSVLLRYLPSTKHIHAYVVVPIFFVTRLGIWPALAYSVLGPESKHWLQQLEKTLWPGSAFLLKTLLTIWHGLVLLMSIIYAGRLIHLSHVRRETSTVGS